MAQAYVLLIVVGYFIILLFSYIMVSIFIGWYNSFKRRNPDKF